MRNLFKSEYRVYCLFFRGVRDVKILEESNESLINNNSNSYLKEHVV